MNRREAIKKSAAVITFFGVVPGLVLNTSCSPEMETWLPSALSEEEGKTLRSIVDVLIPRTGIPSATDVNVHTFIDDMMFHIFNEEHRAVIKDAIQQLNDLSSDKFKSLFHELNDEQRNEVTLDFKNLETEEDSKKLFSEIKKWTVTGYFRSEQVCKTVLRHVEIPGRYDGCVPLEEGQPVWAE